MRGTTMKIELTMKRGFLLIILILFTSCLFATPVSRQEAQHFDSFKKKIPKAYEKKYGTPLPEIILTEITQLRLQPRTIEAYNRDFGTDIRLHKAVGHEGPKKQSSNHILKKIKTKPNNVITFNDLLNIYKRNLPIWMAKEIYQKQYAILENVRKRYGVPRSIVLAVLGCETGWGNEIGNFKILDSLATLSFKAPKKRRPMYFKNLLAFLHLLTKSGDFKTSKIYLGTFDGGMGIPQFEPANYHEYAISYNGDSYPNIWLNIADAAASVANYMYLHGWQKDIPWGYFIKLPKHHLYIYALAKFKVEKPLSFWLKQGVQLKLLNKKEKTSVDKSIKARLYIPTYHGKSDSAFLLTQNFSVLMKWNPSMIESLMVGIISDSLKKRHVNYDTFKN